MQYTLCSGYYKDPDFYKIWVGNIERYCNPCPINVLILSVGNKVTPFVLDNLFSSELRLKNNLGHVGDLLEGKDREFCGWSGAVLTLAMASYANETDMIFLESDTLAFGPWVEKIYQDLGDGDMVFGGKMESEPFMACAQGLFLIRHRFIPAFVMTYIAMGSDARKFEGKSDNLPEDKFHRLREMMPDKIKTLSFGVDRQRPLPINSPVWYAQHFTPEELTLLKEKGLM